MQTWTTFSTAYQKATPEQQAIIDDEVIGKLLEATQTELATKRQAMKVLSYLVLDLADEATTRNALAELLITPDKIDHYITSLLEMLPERAEVLPEIKESVPTVQQDLEVDTPTIPQEPTLDTVSPLRTMSDDMQKVHGYGALRQANATHEKKAELVHSSSQTETLKKETLTPPPSYTESDNE